MSYPAGAATAPPHHHRSYKRIPFSQPLVYCCLRFLRASDDAGVGEQHALEVDASRQRVGGAAFHVKPHGPNAHKLAQGVDHRVDQASLFLQAEPLTGSVEAAGEVDPGNAAGGLYAQNVLGGDAVRRGKAKRFGKGLEAPGVLRKLS